MARSARQISPTGWYHLINRGADRQDIFSQAHDYDVFEDVMATSSAGTGVAVHAYCLMTNHLHLVAQAADGDVSEFMRRLLGGYSVAYNIRHRRDGPLFRGRFTSIPVVDTNHLDTLARYVHRNPLARVPLPALRAYRYSSYGVYLGARACPDWLLTDVVAAGMDASSYASFVETTMPHEQDDPVRWALGARPTLDDLERAVEDATGARPEQIRSVPSSRGNPVRTAAAMLALELRVADAATLAPYFNMSGPDGVRTLARRGRVRAAGDPAFDRLRRTILDRLAA